MSLQDDEIIRLRAENRLLRAQTIEHEQVTSDLRLVNEAALAKIALLESRIERMSKRIFGRSSEKLHPGQQLIDLGIGLELIDDTVTQSNLSQSSDTSSSGSSSNTHEPKKSTDRDGNSKKRPKTGIGRRTPPPDAEVIVEDVTIPESDRLDHAGNPLPLLGYRTTEKWDYRVGTYLIRRFRHAIYGRPFSEANDRIVASPKPCLVPHGKMTDAALIHTVIEKFADHLPLYRQQQRAARVGIHLSRSTLVSHVTAVAAALQPIYNAIVNRVRQSAYIHIDDTPVKVLQPGLGRAAIARIWVYRSAHELAFQFTPTREGRHPAEFLGAYKGFIVADAYAGHERLYGPDQATAVGCWAHVRRKFYDLRQRDPFAAGMVDSIQQLYALEKDLNLVSDDDRKRVRQSKALPLLDHIRKRLENRMALPASDLGRAVAYALNRWSNFLTYTDHGFLPIDNNPAENALRPWAIGRKNWLFLGSQAGGERAAIISTLIENCRLQALDPYAYLTDTVNSLHQGITDYENLTPWAYAASLDRAVG